MTDWDSYPDFNAALDELYSDFMPDRFEDDWAKALFVAGDYKEWAEYMDAEYGWDIDMGEFWHDFREAYNALG